MTDPEADPVAVPSATGVGAQHFIDVAAMLPGSGTDSEPWILTQSALHEAVGQLSWTRKTVYLRAGEYECPEAINLNFAAVFPLGIGPDEPVERDPKFMMLREGVRFMGEGRGTVLRLRGNDPNLVQFHVHWSTNAVSSMPPSPEVVPADCDDDRQRSNSIAPSSTSVRQIPIFFWEFTGLNFKGHTSGVLVQFGGRTNEDTAWNSCVFDVAVNNGFSGVPSLGVSNPEIGDAVSQHVSRRSGGARGIVLKRALQSRIEIVAACHTGVACVLDTCEFNTINGSFSNGEVPCDIAPRGVAISQHAIALYMRDCLANGSTSVNIEVAYVGVRLVGHTRGNTFGSIVSNNCDANGVMFDDDEVLPGMKNVVMCAIRRDVRQEEGRWQPLFTQRSPGTITVMNTLL